MTLLKLSEKRRIYNESRHILGERESMKLSIDEEVFELKQAKSEDLHKVLDLLVQAAEWLQTKNTTQWEYYITNLEKNTQEVIDSIMNGSTYILEKGDHIVASITLEHSANEWDMDIWGQNASEGDAVYLHRLVVHREYAGKSIGSYLMGWAEEYVKTTEKSCIRFDCLANNEGLNNYYQRRYELKEIVNIYGKHCKYEILV
jgi:GNAT superfamily N-acetyltransferase